LEVQGVEDSSSLLPGSTISDAAIDAVIGWWVNQVTSPLAEVEHDVVLDDGTVTTRISNLHAYVKEHDPASDHQIDVFRASLRDSINGSIWHLRRPEDGGVARVRDNGLDGRTGYVIDVDGDPCPALDLAVEAASLGWAWLPNYACTRLMPAYVSATLSPLDPEGPVWRHPTWILPQCSYVRPTPVEEIERMTAQWGTHWSNDPARQQCGEKMFHAGDHQYWRAVYDLSRPAS
jgi:hypothetical protein